MIYRSTKTFTHSVGLSCCFRQWRAQSHCRLLHGYALEIKFTFEAEELDVRNWVVDFGGLKSLKGWLEDMFDHTCIAAEDDPHLEDLKQLAAKGIVNLRIFPATGCEMFAKAIYEYTEQWIKDAGFGPRCTLVSVEVREHQGNSALVSIR